VGALQSACGGRRCVLWGWPLSDSGRFRRWLVTPVRLRKTPVPAPSHWTILRLTGGRPLSVELFATSGFASEHGLRVGDLAGEPTVTAVLICPR
jgi:hypothetical protein